MPYSLSFTCRVYNLTLKIGLTLTVVALLGNHCDAQTAPATALTVDTLSLTIVNRYTHSFSLDSAGVRGDGWDFLTQQCQQSQFVVLGENHYSPKLSDLTRVLLATLPAYGYQQFMLETGPLLAQKIPALFAGTEVNALARVAQFLTTYHLKEGYPPAEFITMKSDVPMYQQAINSKWTIQGLDKEYYSAVVYLLDELKPYCHSKALQEAYRQARGQVIHHQERYRLDNKYPYISSCQTDSMVQHFLTQMAQGPEKGVVIVKELNKMFTVYSLYEAKNYFASEEARIRNFKQNFGICYLNYIKHHKAPFKAFVKIGNNHSMRGLNNNGHSDIGNLIAEVATLNGANSLHIMGMRRYRRNQDGSLNDLYTLGYQVYAHFIQLTDLNRWVVVDLRPLRQLLVEKRLKVAINEEEELIKKHDMVLLTPVDGDYKASLNFN